MSFGSCKIHNRLQGIALSIFIRHEVWRWRPQHLLLLSLSPAGRCIAVLSFRVQYHLIAGLSQKSLMYAHFGRGHQYCTCRTVSGSAEIPQKAPWNDSTSFDTEFLEKLYDGQTISKKLCAALPRIELFFLGRQSCSYLSSQSVSLTRTRIPGRLHEKLA